VLDDEFLRMAFAHHEARPEHIRVGPVLTALAARLTRDHVVAWVGRDALVRRTPNTRCLVDDLHGDLKKIRGRGWATDDEENEIGVGYLAVPVYLTSPATPSGAVRVSALTFRMPLRTLVEAVAEIRGLVGRVGQVAN
jgi:IclR family transcriptional regulator, acetate operon repressor